MPNESTNGIGTAFVWRRKSMPRMTLKSSKGTAKRFILPTHAPILRGTDLANPWIGVACELTAFMRLESFSNLNPMRFASGAAMKVPYLPLPGFRSMSTYTARKRMRGFRQRPSVACWVALLSAWPLMAQMESSHVTRSHSCPSYLGLTHVEQPTMRLRRPSEDIGRSCEIHRRECIWGFYNDEDAPVLREWEESFRELELAPPLSFSLVRLWSLFVLCLGIGPSSSHYPWERNQSSALPRPWRKLDLGLVAFGVPSAPKASVLQWSKTVLFGHVTDVKH